MFFFAWIHSKFGIVCNNVLRLENVKYWTIICSENLNFTKNVNHWINFYLEDFFDRAELWRKVANYMLGHWIANIFTEDLEYERIDAKKVNMMTFGFTFCLSSILCVNHHCGMMTQHKSRVFINWRSRGQARVLVEMWMSRILCLRGWASKYCKCRGSLNCTARDHMNRVPRTCILLASLLTRKNNLMIFWPTYVPFRVF